MAKKTQRLGMGIRSAYRFQAATSAAAATPKTPPPSKRSLLNLNAQLDARVVEQVRDCIVVLQGPPLYLTLARFMESACEREIERLAKAHHKGKPFPKRPAGLDVRRGRPRG